MTLLGCATDQLRDIGAPCFPTSLFNLKLEATPAPASDDDTPHFGARYHPGVAVSHLRAPCAGFPMGRVAHGWAGRCCAYHGQTFSANCLQSASLGYLDVAYNLHVEVRSAPLDCPLDFVRGASWS